MLYIYFGRKINIFDFQSSKLTCETVLKAQYTYLSSLIECFYPNILLYTKIRTIPDDAEAGIRKSSFGAKETSSIEKHFRGKKRVTIMSIEFSRASALLYCRLDFFLLRFVWLCCLVSSVKWNNLSHRFSMPFRVVSLKNSSVTHYLESTRKMRKVSPKVTQVFILSRKKSSPLGIYP